MNVTVCLIPHKNQKRFFKVFNQVVNKTMGEYKLMVVDNNLNQNLRPHLEEYDLKYIYNGNQGSLAGGTNRAIENTKTEFFCYLCSNHTFIYSPDWLKYMVDEISKAPANVAMMGNVIRYNKDIHVQGGLFIAKTEIMQEVPYSRKYPFSYMDVYIKKDLAKKGYVIMGIPYIKSVMTGFRQHHHMDNLKTKKYKIVHSSELHKSR